MGKLKSGELATLAQKRHHDGEGLYLDKKVRGGSWVYKFTLNGHAREMGLGRYPDIGLAVARQLAAKARGERAKGNDPIAERAAVRRHGLSFQDAAMEYWNTHCQDRAKPNDWLNGMTLNIFPSIGKKAVVDLTPDDLIKVLKPMWGQEKTRKLRQWINAVVGYVSADDPRVDRDLMAKVDNRLGPQNIQHDNHPAVAWQEIPRLYAASPTATLVGLSMRLLILTGLRVSCVTLAEWSEIDFNDHVWTVPAGRVKGWKYEYRVPLTGPMVAALREAQRRWNKSGLIFPSADSKVGTLSYNAHRNWLHDHEWKAPDGKLATTHGLRSALRTWMHDRKPPVEWRLSEHLLQHMGSLGTSTELAYLRTDQLDQRRDVLEAWSEFVTSAERHARQGEIEARTLDKVADSDGRTLREVMKWARDDIPPDEVDGPSQADVARRMRDDGLGDN